MSSLPQPLFSLLVPAPPRRGLPLPTRSHAQELALAACVSTVLGTLSHLFLACEFALNFQDPSIGRFRLSLERSSCVCGPHLSSSGAFSASVFVPSSTPVIEQCVPQSHFSLVSLRFRSPPAGVGARPAGSSSLPSFRRRLLPRLVAISLGARRSSAPCCICSRLLQFWYAVSSYQNGLISFSL